MTRSETHYRGLINTCEMIMKWNGQQSPWYAWALKERTRYFRKLSDYQVENFDRSRP